MLIGVKSHASNINLHPLIIKLITAEKTMIKKDYGFDEVFNIFDEIDNKRNKLRKYNPRTNNKITIKNEMLQYLEILEYKLIDMFFTSTFTRKMNNGNYKGYVNTKKN